MSSTKRSFLLAVTVLVGTTGGSEALGRRPFYMRAHVERVEQDRRHGQRRKRFDAYETHAIEFDVIARKRAKDVRPTKLNLYLPNGDLYQTIDLEPHEGRPKRLLATGRLPVSGTFITRFGLFGAWTAEVCWGTGREETCARGMRFVLRR